MRGAGTAGQAGERPRWNEAAQRWDPGRAPVAYVPPPPPRPRRMPYEAQPGTYGAYGGHVAVPGPRAGGGTGPGGGGAGGAAGRPWPGRPVVVGLTVAAALGAVGTAAWLSVDGDEDGPPRADGPGATAPPSAGPDGTPQDGPSAEGADGADGETADTTTAAELPPDFRRIKDDEGFTVAVPEGWERTSGPNGVFYTAPDERSLLQIFRITEAGMTPLEAAREASDNLSGQADGYRELSVGPVTGGPENPDGDAAELHYAYDSADAGGRRECVERVFTAIDGERYALLSCAPDDEPGTRRTVLTTALDHFVPGSP
ncbi:serine/arginine repetitive matrix protein 2 [Streptomyces armeniacus]|uniref:Serine/arginine repetitive matrix protein 2 n=1 Tax=Streptomyces armeniacus TaxID=83291 RepID=A0A345XSE1_9ACTN|nr:serine/arginine repetitive matrix protein 2 [Streptomyces armeniacus]AXK34557.1 serine/arginine repetitive matrix protein 2 [Streptomyces armeniacus]